MQMGYYKHKKKKKKVFEGKLIHYNPHLIC